MVLVSQKPGCYMTANLPGRMHWDPLGEACAEMGHGRHDWGEGPLAPPPTRCRTHPALSLSSSPPKRGCRGCKDVSYLSRTVQVPAPV